MDANKKMIIERFYQNVKGKKAITTGSNQSHDGKVGHWLETQMGVTHNADNKPDLFGYEMKNQTTSGKISFGDWTPDEYIFQHGRPKKHHNTNKNFNITKNEFVRIFGKSNPNKNNRYSWSGIPCPSKYNVINTYGQVITIDTNNDIIIVYDYSKDTRPNKNVIVPKNMQLNHLVLARWKYQSIKNRLEDKFNQKGWFTCTTDSMGIYQSIHFGAPINFNTWLNLFKQGLVFFDSGMKEDESRNYSIWRSATVNWDNLIIDSY